MVFMPRAFGGIFRTVAKHLNPPVRKFGANQVLGLELGGVNHMAVFICKLAVYGESMTLKC